MAADPTVPGTSVVEALACSGSPRWLPESRPRSRPAAGAAWPQSPAAPRASRALASGVRPPDSEPQVGVVQPRLLAGLTPRADRGADARWPTPASRRPPAVPPPDAATRRTPAQTTVRAEVPASAPGHAPGALTEQRATPTAPKPAKACHSVTNSHTARDACTTPAAGTAGLSPGTTCRKSGTTPDDQQPAPRACAAPTGRTGAAGHQAAARWPHRSATREAGPARPPVRLERAARPGARPDDPGSRGRRRSGCKTTAGGAARPPGSPCPITP